MSLQNFIINILDFINDTLIPFILAVAFIIFLWNIVRYFIIGGSNEKEHDNAKTLALYGILAFVIILSLWGIVNLLVDGIGLGAGIPVVPDYMSGVP